MIEDWRFHHLGVACGDLETEANNLKAIGYEPSGPEFLDLRQGVRGQFLVGPGPRMELLQASSGSRVLDAWRGRGITIYHHAYEVRDVAESMAALLARGARLLSGPTAAVAFDERPVAFAVPRNLLVVELIQSAGDEIGQSVEGAARSPLNTSDQNDG